MNDAILPIAGIAIQASIAIWSQLSAKKVLEEGKAHLTEANRIRRDHLNHIREADASEKRTQAETDLSIVEALVQHFEQIVHKNQNRQIGIIIFSGNNVQQIKDDYADLLSHGSSRLKIRLDPIFRHISENAVGQMKKTEYVTIMNEALDTFRALKEELVKIEHTGESDSNAART